MKRTLRIGIRSHNEGKSRLLAIARGETKSKNDEPVVWVSSLASLAQLLSEENLQLLRLIGESQPNSLTQLAELSGRALSNLSRTISSMESYGLVEIVELGRNKAPRLTCDHIEIVMPTFNPSVEAAE
jgi:predicted transcriptional regulator